MNFEEIIITNRLPTGTTFAARSEDNTGVFVPGKIADACELQPGQRVMALLVPNTSRPDRTPWVAVRVDLGDGGATDEERICDLLSEGMMSASEIGKELNADVVDVSSALHRLLRAGHVKSRIFYALQEEDFD